MYVIMVVSFAGILPLDSPCSGLCDVIDVDEQYLGSKHTVYKVSLYLRHHVQ